MTLFQIRNRSDPGRGGVWLVAESEESAIRMAVSLDVGRDSEEISITGGIPKGQEDSFTLQAILNLDSEGIASMIPGGDWLFYEVTNED